MERPVVDARNVLSLTAAPELSRRSVVLGTDVEGPIFLGDAIAEAMENFLKPENPIEATPSYGNIMYSETWGWFTQVTNHNRRTGDLKSPRTLLSLSQEGTDTIFTLPLLLASGATYQDIEALTLKSKPTPGSLETIQSLMAQGVNVFGITTAPQEPYRALVNATGLFDPRQIIGSPFPIEEARASLESSGKWGQEIGTTKRYLQDCYRIIDQYSSVSVEGIRELTDIGRRLLRTRIERFHKVELDITYDFLARKYRKSSTVLGHAIESSQMVGDRAKAAVALGAYRVASSADNPLLVTMGDGANDAEMLRRAPISIGVNGPDAAKAAKIAVVTYDMRDILPIFKEILKGQRDIDKIVKAANTYNLDSRTVICRGGSNVAAEVLAYGGRVKRELRGFVTY